MGQRTAAWRQARFVGTNLAKRSLARSCSHATAASGSSPTNCAVCARACARGHVARARARPFSDGVSAAPRLPRQVAVAVAPTGLAAVDGKGCNHGVGRHVGTVFNDAPVLERGHVALGVSHGAAEGRRAPTR